MTGLRAGRFFRRLTRLATFAALGGLGLLVVGEIRRGLVPHEVGSLGEWRGSNEDMVSSGVRLVQVDERGRPVAEIEAEEAVAQSGPDQRFLGVSVRFVRTHGEDDTLVEADELILDTRRETFHFAGHAVLTTTDLELSGPHLHFRRNPDHLWTPEPTQFRAGEFHGVAGNLAFQLRSGTVSMQGVALASHDDAPIAMVADRARFERETGEILLRGDVLVTTDGFRLESAQTVAIRRNPLLRRVTGLSAGFRTRMEIADEDGAPILTLQADDLDMDLGRGRLPRAIRAVDGARFEDARESRARGETAELRFDDDGNPVALSLQTGVRTRTTPSGSDYWIEAEAQRAELGFAPDGALSAAEYEGEVVVHHGQASARAGEASFDGASSLVFRQEPRIEDRSLLELAGEVLRIEIGSPGRIAGEGGVVGRFLGRKAGWLPGAPRDASILGDRAEIETGSGRARFSGSVRILLDPSLITGDAVTLDAEAGTLAVDGGVESRMRLGDEDLAFFVRSESLRYAEELRYSGAPDLRHRSGTDESRLEARTIVAEIDKEGRLGGLVGEGTARFSRGESRVEGARIRFDPTADELLATGAPAAVATGGRRTEGGEVAIALDVDRWNVLPSPTSRTRTTLRVRPQ